MRPRRVRGLRRWRGGCVHADHLHARDPLPHSGRLATHEGCPVPNPLCPIKGKGACTGVLCGHCKRCRMPIDMHGGVSIKQTPLVCPKV